MPIERIAPLPETRDWNPKACRSPEHNPPTLLLLDPGIYKHTCPACGQSTTFRVEGATWTISWDRPSSVTGGLPRGADVWHKPAGGL